MPFDEFELRWFEEGDAMSSQEEREAEPSPTRRSWLAGATLVVMLVLVTWLAGSCAPSEVVAGGCTPMVKFRRAIDGSEPAPNDGVVRYPIDVQCAAGLDVEAWANRRGSAVPLDVAEDGDGWAVDVPVADEEPCGCCNTHIVVALYDGTETVDWDRERVSYPLDL